MIYTDNKSFFGGLSVLVPMPVVAVHLKELCSSVVSIDRKNRLPNCGVCVVRADVVRRSVRSGIFITPSIANASPMYVSVDRFKNDLGLSNFDQLLEEDYDLGDFDFMLLKYFKFSCSIGESLKFRISSNGFGCLFALNDSFLVYFSPIVSSQSSYQKPLHQTKILGRSSKVNRSIVCKHVVHAKCLNCNKEGLFLFSKKRSIDSLPSVCSCPPSQISMYKNNFGWLMYATEFVHPIGLFRFLLGGDVCLDWSLIFRGLLSGSMECPMFPIVEYEIVRDYGDMELKILD